MGCSHCGNASTGKPAGCKSNGYCVSGGCEKKDVFDWLNFMDLDGIDGFHFPFVEVRFKNGRKEFFENLKNLIFNTSDWVVVNVPGGHHIGKISLQGELVRAQLKKKKVSPEYLPEIYRKATDRDLEKFREAQNRETSSLYKARKIILELGLQMKLSDVEFQADNLKATFFYSAEERVDFRELIKRLASEFNIRVEMKQISLRQEASFLGGIGSCGRELCCSTWLTEFNSVPTSCARYQNLSMNPNKLSGQCGRLKCCLNYELDTYKAALKGIPKINQPLITQKGNAYLQRTDIFRKIMYFGFKDESVWHSIPTLRVKQIIEKNNQNEIPFSLENDIDKGGNNDPVSNVETKDLEAYDRKLKKKSKKKKKGNFEKFRQNPNDHK
jgi:cell fate regulator YaaT (PSP1 superfamily)